jgi:small GTP-binding protein
VLASKSLTQKKLLFLGPDNAGKTSILLQLKDNQFNEMTRVPTVGLNIESIVYQKYEFTLWDVGGSRQAARLWKHYFDKIDGVLFCLDIADRTKLRQCKEMLWRVNEDPLMEKVPFLIYMNKIDKDESQKMSQGELTTELLLESLATKR